MGLKAEAPEANAEELKGCVAEDKDAPTKGWAAGTTEGAATEVVLPTLGGPPEVAGGSPVRATPVENLFMAPL